MTTSVLAAPAAMTIPQKLDLIEGTMALSVFERTTEIETSLTAMVAGAHHLQIGAPGIGKTFLINKLHELIDMGGLGYFRWLMSRFTVPEELFGPVSLKGMENDEYRRNTAYKLPTSVLVFLDEFFKANSAILNTLLTIMEERIFFNNGVPTRCAPIIFAGSNEIPKEAELAALWDRVTFRHFVKDLQNWDSKEKMLKNMAARTFAANPTPLITWAEIEQAQAAAKTVEVPQNVISAYLDLWRAMIGEGIEPSSRRYSNGIPIIQATAYRDGRSVAEVCDMRHLRHTLWLVVGDIPKVDKAVLALADPLDAEARKLIDELEVLTAEVNVILKSTDNINQRRNAATSLGGKLTRLEQNLDDLQKRARSNGKRSSMIGDAEKRLRTVADNMLATLFGTDTTGRRP